MSLSVQVSSVEYDELRMDLVHLLEEYNDYKRPGTLVAISKLMEENGRLMVNCPNEVGFLNGLGLLVQAIAESDKIKAICISNTSLAQHSSLLVPVFSKLTVLSLLGTKLGQGPIDDFAKGLTGNVSITDLYLPKNEIGNAGIQSLSSALVSNSTIKTLDLSGNSITVDGARHLCPAMASMSCLSSVNLHSNSLGPTSGESLAQFIEESGSLEILNLRNTELGDQGVKQIAIVLGSSKSLNTLDVSGNQISGEGADALATGLSNNKSVSSLYMSKNDIGDARLEGFTTMLQNNTTLTLLDLNWNGINSNGVKTLSNALPTNQTLTSLDISMNVLKEADLNELCHALLHTTITTCRLLDNQVANEIAKTLPVRPININKAGRRIQIGKQAKSLLNNEFLPRSMVDEEEIYQFLMVLQKEQTKRRQVRILLLGDYGVGKTTLMRNFQHIQKSFWELTKARFMGKTTAEPKPTVGIDEYQIEKNDINFVAWDYSGNEDCLEWLRLFLPTEMVLYVVCYDLSADVETQKAQIDKWLGIIGPIFANPGPKKAILVGLRADKKATTEGPLDTSQWRSFAYLDEKVFAVSSKDVNSVKKLWNEIVKEGKTMMQAAPQLPAYFYSILLRTLQQDKRGLVRQDRFHEYGLGEDWEANSNRAMLHLQGVGDLVCFDHMVCTNPVVLSKKLAGKSVHIDRLQDVQDLRDLGEGGCSL